MVFAVIFCLAAVLHIQALDFSLGGGQLIGYTFTRYTLEDTGTMPGQISSPRGNLVSKQSMDRFDYGVFLFFDASYVEFSILFEQGINTYHETLDFKLAEFPAISMGDGAGAGSELNLGFSLRGKYPFPLTKRLSVFPLAGVEYQIALLEERKPNGENDTKDRTSGELPEDVDKDGHSYPLSAWNALWINIGAGMDYTLSGGLYLRWEVLFGFRLPTGYENGALENVKKRFNASDPKLKGLTGSPVVVIGFGYRFAPGQ
jgi:hypothetical protein